MHKELNPEKKNFRSSKKNVRLVDRPLDENQEPRFAGMNRSDFLTWLKALPTQERYLMLKVTCPEIIRQVFILNSKFGDSWRIEMDPKKATTRLMKNFLLSVQCFIDGVVFLSDEDYLDSIGFDFSFVGCPQKLFQTLSLLSGNKSRFFNKENQRFLIPEKEEWIFQVLKTIQEQYERKVSMEWDPLILQRERSEKKQFGNLWKNLHKQQKINFLLLNHQDIEDLSEQIFKQGGKMDVNELEEEIKELVELDKKQICNKIFKCKIKKANVESCTYYEMIYNCWRQFPARKKKQQKYQGKKKVKGFNKKEKSEDVSSNQTNQSQLKEAQLFIQDQQIYQNIHSDILQCTDHISQISNSFHQSRILAFQRIGAIFRLYNVSCKLFGSCANGIAIKQSDIDIAINDSILQLFKYEEDKKSQMGKAFQFMGQIFQELPWVKKVKVIKTASIPIIKLSVDTSLPVEQNFFTSQYREILNRKVENSGQIHADLTIQVKEQENGSSSHLGLISTNQISKWIDQIPTLQPIIILLKYELSKKMLNQTYTGGLNTYCLVVMLVSYIYDSKLSEEKNVGIVMMKLLKYYGCQFNEKMKGIDLRGKDRQNIFYDKVPQDGKGAELEVKDPLNKGKVMTKNCYQFEKIKSMFENILKNCMKRKQDILKEKFEKEKKKLMKLKSKFSSSTEEENEMEKQTNYFMELIS